MVERSISISRADVNKHTNKATAVKVQGVGLTIYAYFQSDDGKEVTLFAEKPDGENYVKRFAKSGTTDINFDDGKTAIHRVKVNISGQIPQPIEKVLVTMNDILKEKASDKDEVVFTNDALYEKGSTQTIKPSRNVYAGYKLQGITTQVNIDNASKSLNTAVKNLVKVDIPAPSLPLQLSVFKTAVNKANAIKNDGYTNATWTTFNNARNASKDLLVRAEAQNNSRALITQAQIDNSVKTLDNATKNLKKEVKVDFSALKETVTNANKLTSNGYTKASFNSFAKVRTASTKTLNNAKATQAQVNKANKGLNQGMTALKKV
ncbi:hypothetical protein [Brochothrix thermosphacta]|uniref:hypothetical protein n=1 Tax=Brochothrix thermosphacta TaxID=2756 RepID=UPI003F9DECD3